MSDDNIKKWLDQIGKIFLTDVGIRHKHTVLDLGCGTGNYAIPAARVVGKGGKVYAIDKNRKSLDELIQRAKERRLENIEMVEAAKGPDLPLQDKSVDVVLLYDVIHLVDNRKELLSEIYRVSRQNTIISVYPKHHQEDMNMDLDDIKDEIETAGFSFERKLCKILMHNNYLEQGYVLNFRKQ